MTVGFHSPLPPTHTGVADYSAALLALSVDWAKSTQTPRRLDAEGKQLDVMLEVKLSPEQSKAGADPGSLDDLVAAVRTCHNLNLAGLMTMPPWTEDAEPSRPYFSRLRQLAQKHSLPNCRWHVARLRGGD